MKLRYHKFFQKQFNKLPAKQKMSVKKAAALFETEPMHQSLYNHPLKGQWQNHRSITAGGDLRIHYRLINPDTVLFVAVGTHSQLYK